MKKHRKAEQRVCRCTLNGNKLKFMSNSNTVWCLMDFSTFIFGLRKSSDCGNYEIHSLPESSFGQCAQNFKQFQSMSMSKTVYSLIKIIGLLAFG